MRTRTLLLVVIAGCVLSAVLVFNFLLKNVTQGSARLIENVDAGSQPEQTDFGLPARLTIPAINVEATVEYVGLTPEGAMDVPKNPGQVAWYERGPLPGEPGSAVMAGHFDGKKGEPEVFANLDQLKPGDKIYVDDERETTTTFVVVDHRRYDPDANAGEVFGVSDGKAHLNLITCEGAWDTVSQTYSQRLVVFAEKEVL